jgi:hypothetical protein
MYVCVCMCVSVCVYVGVCVCVCVKVFLFNTNFVVFSLVFNMTVSALQINVVHFVSFIVIPDVLFISSEICCIPITGSVAESVTIETYTF